jgi:nucleotide-binding universal stress UspA family protein
MKILIGYDGSECADASIDDLRRAGLPERAEVQILSVAETWLPPQSSGKAVDEVEEVASVSAILAPMYAKAKRAMQEAEALAQRARTRVSALFPSWTVTATASYGSPAWELVFACDNWQPDLVVVGSQGRSAVGRLVLGSVSQVVVTEAPCSVRVARGRIEEPDTPIRIVLGVDGSVPSENAVREVAQRAWPASSEVKLIVVDDAVSAALVVEDYPQPEDADREDLIHGRAKKILANNTAILRDLSSLEVSTEIIEGNPKHELVRAAEEWRADCIFVGSAGSSNTRRRFVLGSVAAAVASRAHCSVEVVRKK